LPSLLFAQRSQQALIDIQYWETMNDER